MINPQSLFARLVPSEFRPLLACVSPNAFRVLEWQKVLSHAPTLAKRIATRDGVAALKTQLSTVLPKDITMHPDEITSNAKPSSVKPDQGTSILALYFAQFNSEHGMFLDLRPSNFYLSTDDQILWRPNGFWTQLNPEFRQGMQSIYAGYYQDQPQLLRKGLKQVGLITDDFSAARVSQVEGMILAHIGGDTSNQKFQIAHYTQSFEKLFQFLIKEKIVLPQDFLYLGIYLASLYIHLEALGGTYNVRQAYTNAKRENQPGLSPN